MKGTHCPPSNIIHKLSNTECVSKREKWEGVRVHKTIIVSECRKWGRSGEHTEGCGNATKGRHTASVLPSHSQLNQGPLHKPRSYSLWPTPLPSQNSSSAYQHHSFLVIPGWRHLLYFCGLIFLITFLICKLFSFLPWFIQCGGKEQDSKQCNIMETIYNYYGKGYIHGTTGSHQVTYRHKIILLFHFLKVHCPLTARSWLLSLCI